VALARSLAPGPRLLMLDEPLGSLDRTLREEVMNELRDILKRVGVTTIYVTHDQQEAFAIADRVFVMRPDPALGGRVEQAGTPQEVYRQPVSPFVARFLGFHNLLPGTLAGQIAGATTPAVDTGVGAGTAGPGCVVDTALGLLHAGGMASCGAPGEAVTVLIRPDAARLLPVGTAGPNLVSGLLAEASFRGGFYLVRMTHPAGIDLVFTVPATGLDLPAPGRELALWLDPRAITLLHT
jgi:ABC-type Fe3+/spermidine/putrescine transport system ATPase subunit